MRIAFGLALLGAGCIYACGGSGSSRTTSGSPGADAGAAGDNGPNGGNGSAGKGGNPSGGGDSGASNGDAGEGGAAGSSPDSPPVVISTALPHAAGGLVAGGVVAHSAHFTGVFSLGAAPGGNRILTSATHQLRGGVLGASQK
ncbi:MAG: hypothetical protein ABJB12_19000 [Pseudomonadota bacterium]